MNHTHHKGGLGRIRAALPGLSPKLQSIASHILEQPQEILHLTISQLAEVTASSDATIFRLCRQLGFEGYQDMKISLAREIVDQPVDHLHEELHITDDMKTVAHKVFQSNITGLTDTLHILDPDTLARAIQLLNSAPKVEFYGNGGSGLIAIDAYHKFMRTGIDCIAHTDSHFQVMSAGLLKKGSVAVGISYSGSNKDILEVFRVAKANGVKTIAITSYQKSPLTQLADISLYTSTREASFRTEAMAARLAQLSIIDVLYIGVSLLRPEQTLSNLQIIRKMIALKRM